MNIFYAIFHSYFLDFFNIWKSDFCVNENKWKFK